MESLPKEMILEIISYLPNYSIQQFMKTSKSNCELCEVVWKRKLESFVEGYHMNKDPLGKTPLGKKLESLVDDDCQTGYSFLKTKLVYNYRKYSRGLEQYLVDEIRPKINQMSDSQMISHRTKLSLLNECFDLYVLFKDIFLHHNVLSKLKETIRNKLHEFLMSEKSDFGSNRSREMSYQYYPLLFPEVFYFTLFINSGFKIIGNKYGIQPDYFPTKMLSLMLK
jgi:hypothetical protein